LVNSCVYFDCYSPWLIPLWISSWVLPIIIIANPWESSKRYFSRTFQDLWPYLILLLPILVRVINYNATRAHGDGDDILIGYFSAHIDLIKTNFFSPVPESRGDWPSQHPAVFFFLQKLFFLTFGESRLTIKLSVLPYVLAANLFLLFIVKRLFDNSVALLTVVLHSFFAFSIYMETMGFLHIFSTAAFLAFFYFIVKDFEINSPQHAFLGGIACAFCYLCYYSTYIAVPLASLLYVLRVIKKRSAPWQSISSFTIAFFLTFGPFLIYALKNGFYFKQRFEQASLLGGTWSTNVQGAETTSVSSMLWEHLIASVKALYLDGIGGGQGYYFGHTAFFDHFSLCVLMVGTIGSIGFYLRTKKIEVPLTALTLVLSYITVVFSIPPPSYHRASLTFPFIAILATIPFYFFSSLQSLGRRMRIALISLTLSGWIYGNIAHFRTSTKNENTHRYFIITDYIRDHFPERNCYVAAFPGYAFDRFLYFTPGIQAKRVETHYHSVLIERLKSDKRYKEEKYVYAILDGSSYASRFREADSNGRVIGFRDIALFVN